jgi:vesicle-fusing ATPase
MFVGFSSESKCNAMIRIFEDSYKSPLSLILLDNIERLIEYVPIGPHFSNPVLQTLMVLVKRKPPNPKHKLAVLATTSSIHVLKNLSFDQLFMIVSQVPSVCHPLDLHRVLCLYKVAINDDELKILCKEFQERNHFPIGIKRLLMIIEMACTTTATTTTTKQPLTAKRIVDCLHDCD